MPLEVVGATVGMIRIAPPLLSLELVTVTLLSYSLVVSVVS